MDSARTDAVAKIHAAGRLTARERLATLLDIDSFVEYGVLAGKTSQADDANVADGLVSGTGLLYGKPVVAASYDSSILNGTQSERNQRKLGRLIYLAKTHRWPFICFVDGDGARQDDPPPPPPIAIAPRGRWDVFDGLAELSGWAPTVAILSGRALDGHAGIAMLCDLVVATRDSSFGSWGGSKMFSEPVTRSATDYERSGNIDLLVDDEPAAISAVQKYLSCYLQELPEGQQSSMHDEIASIIPENRRRPYDMRKVITAFADADSVLELGVGWGRSMLTCLARLGGRCIGIFANQPKSPLAGAIDSDAADKASRFIELCDCWDIPLVSFIDNPGYMVGPQAERDGMARHHARPLSALHHRSVPLCSVQIRKAYGLGPYAMSGFGTSRVTPELRLAWPSVESGGMSLEGAAYLVKRKEIHAAKTQAEALAIRDSYAEQMRDHASGLRAGRNMMFDDIIDPTETRGRIMAMIQRFPRTLSPIKKHPIDLR
jgi:acetyl-CoA carboxylase carboxyltransferase component